MLRASWETPESFWLSFELLPSDIYKMILRFGALAASWKRQDDANVGRDCANMVLGWCTGGQDGVNVNQDGIKVDHNGA